MWSKKTVAVIFPTYREKNSIFKAIQEFDSSGYVDEIIVVDNNAEKGTQEQVGKTRARLVIERDQGYGKAIKTGIDATDADLLIVTEPDGTFDGKDVIKLLSYSDDFDIVFGSRTHVPLIKSGAGMHFLRRILDVMLGKLIAFLFLSSTFTDVGCTLRLTNRKSWTKIKKKSKSNGALFATEWQLIAARENIKFIEIPVNYRKRIGRSSLTDTFLKQAFWGILIFFYIWKVWFFSLIKKLSKNISS